MDDDQRAAIERACERLVIRYTHSIDLNKREALAEVFCEDAIIDTAGLVRRGREILAPPPGPALLMRHICSNILIDVLDERRATGVSYLLAYVQAPEDGELRLPAVLGEYYDEFILTENGWRIANRRFQPTLRVAPANT